MFAQKRGCPLVRVSGRLKIVQRFIAGVGGKLEMKSMKRTAERVEDPSVLIQPSALTDYKSLRSFTPSSELLGYYQPSALRTETYFLCKAGG